VDFNFDSISKVFSTLNLVLSSIAVAFVADSWTELSRNLEKMKRKDIK
jgi:hypothetical protein